MGTKRRLALFFQKCVSSGCSAYTVLVHLIPLCSVSHTQGASWVWVVGMEPAALAAGA